MRIFMKLLRRFLLLLAVILVLVIYNYIDEVFNHYLTPPVSAELRTPLLPKAQTYQILSERDISTLHRKRRDLTILSPSETQAERAHTVMKAALEVQQRSGDHFVSVHLVPSPLLADSPVHSLASADYSPDGHGFSGEESCRWYVLSGNLRLSAQEIAILEMFETHKWKHRGQGPFPEVEATVRAVAREMKSDPQAVAWTLLRAGDKIELGRAITHMECNAGQRWLENRKITGTHIGCRNPETHHKLARSATDPSKFRRVLASEEARGECRTFEAGEEVFVTDRSRLLNGLVRVVRSGDRTAFWILAELMHM